MATWKLIEDVTLCECWVHITHDPITGNEMELREMWSRIKEAFCARHGKDDISNQGLQGCWKKLNISFTCWKNALSIASNNLRNGTSLADQVTIFLFIYMYSTHINILIYLFVLHLHFIILSYPTFC